ncbi:MAG: integrase [Firmicutes bacterium]|nr:integrase [Bacillota bacterium]
MLHDYKTYLQGRGLSQRTISSYANTLLRFEKWIEQTYGQFDATAITPLDIADYRRQLSKKDKKPATINHALDVLNSFFTWAYGEAIVQANPTAGIKRVQEQKNAPRWLDRRELGALIRSVQKYGKERDIVLIMILLHAGLRVSEAVALRLEDIVLRERSGFVRVWEGKGGKYREVPLNITVRRVMEGYLKGAEEGWLFPGRRGGHITSRAAENVIKKYGRLAQVNVTPHMLRHCFGKMLIDAGESLDRVAVLMGHANLNTTARYTRPSTQDLECAVEKLAWD